jgi:hypothetical protein
MKAYPSIPRNFREFQAYIFDKLDGSNIRMEWTRKGGWVKFGARNRLMDESDSLLGEAKPLFFETMADKLAKIAVDQRWDRIIAFAEFYGPNSFAGNHVIGESKQLTLFDVNVHKKGILGPRQFLKIFGDEEFIPKFFGIHNWTRGFLETVRDGSFEGPTFEGVVGKAGEGHKLIMAKAKTQAWVDKVKEVFHGKADEIINS